ncbi:MAG: Gfo/Idh/MocA family oxidoreductase [Planctomycetaceae bacterium]|nr:Gfo/Idh/MocA family oxidoreductase [Planctomycetaceae bacterium]
MTEPSSFSASRRDFLKNSGKIASATALVGASLSTSGLYAGEDNTIQVALVGCGGRGTGAAANALATTSGPIKLVAMADVFADKLSNSYNSLVQGHEKQLDVPEERKFIGFDGYKQAMDSLRPGDVVILTTPPAFRWVHFTYAIEKGLNVFMEKPVTVDGPTTRKMFELGDKSIEKNLKVGVGLMCRHCDARRELFDRIQNGEIGDILELRAYRMAGLTGSAFAERKPEGTSELMYQIRNFHAFLWLSGGAYSDFLIHNIDESCWMKDAWPVSAEAGGGRHYKGDYVDQNFDNYNVEYTFADGTKLFLRGRTMPGCYPQFASYAHGTKGLGVISTASHSPARCRIYKGYNEDNNNLLWAYPQPEKNPYQLEWDHLIEAIRNDTPYNEVHRGAEASLITSMGRMAAHTGRLITRDEMLNCEHEFAPGVDSLVLDGPSPLPAFEDGTYPVPLPGLVKETEYPV